MIKHRVLPKQIRRPFPMTWPRHTDPIFVGWMARIGNHSNRQPVVSDDGQPCHLRDNILHTLIDVRLVAHVHNANETIGHRAMEPMPSHSFSTGRRSSSGLRHWSIGQIHANRPDIRHRKDGDVSNQIDEMRPRRYSSLVARIPDQDRIISLVGLKGDLGRRQRVAICQRPGARQYRQCVAHRKITSARRSLWYPTPLRLQPGARR